MIREEDLHPIGKFAKTHGIKGEISLVTVYDLADICDNNNGSFIVCDMDGIRVPFFIESYRIKNDTVTLVKFENLESEENVRILSGKTAYVPLAMLPSNNDQPTGLNGNTFEGFTLMDERLGSIGQIMDIDDSTMNILLKVDYNGREILVPAALVTSIHHHHQLLNISLPEGFFNI